MAVLSGNDGSVSLPSGHNIVATAWAATVSQRIYQTDGFGDSWSTFVGGAKGMVGTVRGRMKYDASTTTPGATAISTTGGSFVLTAATGCTFSFTGIISDVSMSSDRYDTNNVNIEFRFVSSGTVTPAWDESA